MKILFLNAYFYPENTAFCHLEQDIINGLVHAGHEVCVVCPIPSRGISAEDAKKYRNNKHEYFIHIHVYRYWAPAEGNNPIVRAFRYFWCNFRGNQIARKYTDVDAVFAVSTPPTQGLFAGKAAHQLRAKLVYSVQDLFPDSLVTSGLVSKHSLTFKLGELISKKTFKRCSSIIALNDTVKKNLISEGVDEKKISVIGNWVDPETVRPVPREVNPLFDDCHIDRNQFIVVYAGNFGASQGAIIILKAAEKLKDEQGIHFVIFGGGAEFEEAERYARNHHLSNISVFPLVPEYRVAEAYSMGDVALITCKKGVSKTAMPSKTWNIMACNTPIIASFDTDSELSEILDESGAGVCIEPENEELLAKTIKKTYKRRIAQTKKVRKTSPREYVIKHASKEESVQKYLDCIEETAHKE